MLNYLPNNIILDLPNLRAFADKKIIKCDSKQEFNLGRAENIVWKRENVSTCISLTFTIFSKAVFLKVVKSLDCLVKV